MGETPFQGTGKDYGFGFWAGDKEWDTWAGDSSLKEKEIDLKER